VRPDAEFIEAACIPLDRAHGSGTLERADAILAAYPDLAETDIHVAAILGDDRAVRRFLELVPGSATAVRAPRGWDALTHLCFSRYLRLDPARSQGFVRAAAALLDAGASANTGFLRKDHEPESQFESALYGAAGIAHHAALTRLLLERGANPNDDETPYHTPEGYDDAALQVLVESGKVNGEGLATMLVRKHDWHHYEGIRWLLEHGADPNGGRRRGFVPTHHAVTRDNALPIIELLLVHGADPTLVSNGQTAVAIAARRGRTDLLDLFEGRGFDVGLRGVERLVAACARNDAAGVRSIAASEPALVRQLAAEGGRLLAEFAGNGNTEGVGLLLELGVGAGTPFIEGDGYWDLARESTALHVAAWRMRHETVKFLIAHGAPVDARDVRGRTPLLLAVKACVDSHWRDWRSLESIEVLLRAGASVSGIDVPSGYAEADGLLRAPAGGTHA
jgi:ankyrin repeat protein